MAFFKGSLPPPNSAQPGDIGQDAAGFLYVNDGSNWIPFVAPTTAALDRNTSVTGYSAIATVNGSLGAAPTPPPGCAAMAYDFNNNRLWVRNGASWKSVQFA